MGAERHDSGRGAGKLRFEAEVPEADAGGRLDVFLAGLLADRGVSRGRVQKAVKAGRVRVDGEIETSPKLKLVAGGRVRIDLDFPREGLRAVEGELDLAHRDEHLLVVNKPAGLTVHPAPGEAGPTLVNHLVHEIPELAALDPERPGIAHRIDKDTSGLLAVALDEKTRLDMARMFAERKVEKAYLAVCFGVPVPTQGRLDEPIGRDPANRTRMIAGVKGGREALSEYETLWTSSDGRFSLLAVRILTGRTHQIRVHLAHAGHPLAGDRVYGPRENAEWERENESSEIRPPRRQMLHAWRLGFEHPATGEKLRFGARPPEDFMEFIAGLAREPLVVGVVGMPGSGKSALVGFWSEAGMPVFSADACVAGLYEAGADGAELIAGRFGGRYNDESGAVDKKALFHAMQEDDSVRREVMDLVHPLVKHALREFRRDHPDADVIAAEVPLLLEAGWRDRGLVDLAVCVTAHERVRRERLAKSRGWSEEVVARMESWQWPQDKKAAACEIVIDNSGGLDDLEHEAVRLLSEFENEFEKRDAERRRELMTLTDPYKDEKDDS